MCGTCGCGGTTKAKITNLETGVTETLGYPPDEHVHEHVHGDGMRHIHAHTHGHDHTHEHECDHHHHHSHEHTHADGLRHTNSHTRDHHQDHAHAHAEGEMHGHSLLHRHDHYHAAGSFGAKGERATITELETRLLAKNDALAERNRAWFAGREILTLNIVSAPGAGKTTLLERTIRDLADEFPIAVIEGDQATSNDGERIRAAGAPCVQVNTGTGCHLEADMVARGLAELKPRVGSVVLIENVGNLVCPALFDLGERTKVAILSVTEGEDKPLKYPHMFKASGVMIVNKIDLAPHVDFDVETAVANARAVNPDITVLRVSARTGEGLAAWYDWIRREAEAARGAALLSTFQ